MHVGRKLYLRVWPYHHRIRQNIIYMDMQLNNSDCKSAKKIFNWDFDEPNNYMVIDYSATLFTIIII